MGFEELVYDEPPKSMRERPSGSTTMKQCGWCRYASGIHRHNYCIEGRCIVLWKYNSNSKIKWDTNCIIREMSKAEIDAEIRRQKLNIEELQSRIESIECNLITLSIAIEDAPYIPPLPSDRKHNHFEVGDSVAVFCADKKTWFFGEVKLGYRHQDGCVSYRLNGVGPQDGKYWGMGVAVPYVMLLSEYAWFASNREYYKKWCEKAYNEDFNGKSLVIAEIKKQ